MTNHQDRLDEAVRCRDPSKSFWALVLTRFHINNGRGRIYSGFVPDAPDTAQAIALPARLTAATKK